MQKSEKEINLHSNMVRFIIDYKLICLGVLKNLHSNMVRFIIILNELQEPGSWKFTFQYG